MNPANPTSVFLPYIGCGQKPLTHPTSSAELEGSRFDGDGENVTGRVRFRKTEN